MYAGPRGEAVIYNVYTAESACYAQLKVLETIVRGPVICTAVELREKGF